MGVASLPTAACIGDAEHVDYSRLCHHAERTRLQIYCLCVSFACFCPHTAFGVHFSAETAAAAAEEEEEEEGGLVLLSTFHPRACA